MQIAKLGLLAAVIIGAVLGVLWATGVVEPDQVGLMARNAYAGLAVLLVAAAALRVLRGQTAADQTDRPVP